MLQSIFNTCASVARLTELKVRLGLHLVGQAGSVTMAYMAAAAIALFGVLGLLGAGYLAIAPTVGPAGALALMSGVGLGLSLFVWFGARWFVLPSIYRRQRAEIEEEMAVELEKIRAAFGVTAEPLGVDGEPVPRAEGTVGGSGSGRGFDASAIAGMMDLKVLAAAGFAAMSLLGPTNVLRVVRLAAAVISTTAVVSRAASVHREGGGGGKGPAERA